MSDIFDKFYYSNIGLILSFCLIFLLSFGLTYFYRSFAINKEIIANPNNRSLHKQFIPSGGGIVFSSIYVLLIGILGFFEILRFEMLMVFGLGAFSAALFGFVDDLYDINALVKLFIQFSLSVWVLVWFDIGGLDILSWLPFWLSWFLSCFLLIWIMNLYNFMDGVDGMAASGTIFACVALIIVLIITSGFSNLVILLSLLLFTSLGFVLYNWPPANIFMGDSGSVFLGSFFGALIVISLIDGGISFWPWLIVFSYFIGDTHTTILMRLALSKNWYKPHRSHAYQNLARILDSHIKVTSGVQMYNIFYILPLTVFSVLQPGWAPFLAILALTPVIFLSLWFGPRYSVD